MKLKNDWSWAHFLLNISRLSYGIMIVIGIRTVIFPIFTQSFFDEIYATDMLVSMDYEIPGETYSSDYEFAKIHLNRPLSGNIIVRTNETTDAGFIVYIFSIHALQVIIGLLFFHFLTPMLKNVAEHDPFNMKNPKYLYRIGWLLVGAGIAKGAIYFSPIPFQEKLLLPAGFAIRGFLLYGDNLILLGIFSFVLGYVFQEAVRIHEEQKLTV